MGQCGVDLSGSSICRMRLHVIVSKPYVGIDAKYGYNRRYKII